MIIEKIHNNIRYRLSNENLEVGDKVFPIAKGRIDDDNNFILHSLEYNECTSGFPYLPHTILDLHYSTYKPYEIKTDMGYSPIECYFKIIKKEKQIESSEQGDLFKTYMWVTLNEVET